MYTFALKLIYWSKHQWFSGLADLEALRMERKRKQMEKQAEYKRLMKEKEQQKPNDIRKHNSKY